MIIDYSRRTDPACAAGLKLFQKRLRLDKPPAVLHFWTKAPAVLAELYGPIIRQLQAAGSIVCAQVTLNAYDPPLEAVSREMRELGPLVGLLGKQAVRLRFDPIILGYTTLHHYKQVLAAAERYQLRRITVNFLVPGYEGVGNLLAQYGISAEQGSVQRKIATLQRLRAATPKEIDLAVCAETAALWQQVPGLTRASCADPAWFKALGLVEEVSGHASRPGCGCLYSADWGKYPTQGSYICPHKCLYCYAKHNVYSSQQGRQQELFRTR